MTTPHPNTTAKTICAAWLVPLSRLPQILPATSVAVGAITALMVFAARAAHAEPSWDIEQYDKCIADIDRKNSTEIIVELIKYCCDQSGGVWKGEQGHTVDQMCAAPSVVGINGGQPTNPPTAPIHTVPVEPPTVGTPSTTSSGPLAPGVPVKPPVG